MGFVEEKVEINVKETILKLTKLTYKNLNEFMKIPGIKEEFKPKVFMSNIMQNFISNLLVQAADGDAEEIKDNFVVFTTQLISFFQDVLPVIETHLKSMKEMH